MQTFIASFDTGSALNATLFNRAPNAWLALQFMASGSKNSTSIIISNGGEKLLHSIGAKAGSVPIPRAADNKNTELIPPLVVTGRPLQSFGFSVRVSYDLNSGHIANMAVNKVLPRSNAERAGLEAGDRILALDGRPVQTFIASFDTGSALNATLFNRARNAWLTLEFMASGAKNPTTVVIWNGGEKLLWINPKW